MLNTAQLDTGTLSAEEMDAMATGLYEDAFAVLGPHRHPSGTDFVIRAFLPWATTVDVIARHSGHKVCSLVRTHKAGIFEGAMGNHKGGLDYFLRIDGSLDMEDPYRFPSCLDDEDLYLFSEGTQEHSYRWMGSHARSLLGIDGVCFVVWAPNAKRVSVVGDFNDWDGRRHVMRRHPGSGVWEIFIPNVGQHSHYKYEILDSQGHLLPLKADPYARSMQHPPQTASRVVFNDDYPWGDAEWMARRKGDHHLDQPLSIYEVHAGSWRRKVDQGNRYLSYRELAAELIPYVLDMRFTHIQLMPVSEYPFDGSWGYQPIGMYAPTIRFGTPDEFKYFVDQCHRHGIGVLLDWVPGHFPSDPHGLGRFDGTCLYEHQDSRKGMHPDWNTLIYNYGRGEVMSYLLSNANCWFDEFHVDGLRVDAVASMLYLDFSREEGEWLPNQDGGRENLEAVDLIKAVNSRMYKNHPGIMMVAEESTAWPGVSRPVDGGGLGFGFKWNLGWMNDTLRYLTRDPLYRRHHHDDMTFGLVYAWDENFILPLSHDEVVHGKGSLLGKMPGDHWQQFANLRAYLGFMWGHPGKKLLFMGGEFAQRNEWHHDACLDWHLLDEPFHRGVQALVRDLNRVYCETPALYCQDCSPEGFQWLQLHNRQQSIFAWIRYGGMGDSPVVVVVNMTPQSHFHYRLGVPRTGRYVESINTDSLEYGGSGQGNGNGAEACAEAWDGQPASLFITVPPLATVIFRFFAD